jgi:hypothetical protein
MPYQRRYTKQQVISDDGVEVAFTSMFRRNVFLLGVAQRLPKR